MAATSCFRESQCFIWEINNFSQLNGKISSPDFSALNSKWRITINPFVWPAVPSDRMCVEIYLKRVSGKTKNCCVHFDLFIENPEKKYEYFDSFSTHLQYEACAWTMRYSKLKKAMYELSPGCHGKIICYIDTLEVDH